MRISDGMNSGTLDFHRNRVVNSGVKGVENLDLDGDAVDAENNWWGCNEGPVHVDCDGTTGTVDSDPWLTLTATSPTTTPLNPVGVTGSLRTNSAGADVGALSFQNLDAAFAESGHGAIDPPTASITDGTADATYTRRAGCPRQQELHRHGRR